MYRACVTKMWNIVSTGKKGIKLTDIGKCCVYRQKDKKMTDTGKCCVHRRKGRRRLLPSLRMVVVLWWRPGEQPSHFFHITTRIQPSYIHSNTIQYYAMNPSPGLVKLNSKAAKNLRRSRATGRGLPKKGQSLFLRILHICFMAKIGAIVRMSFSL